ncbi:MAG: WYL domain-containing protein [Dehalococcoidia bacterium]|nr:WYL domain-containing protein [Dehalococcoidia bacterium]
MGTSTRFLLSTVRRLLDGEELDSIALGEAAPVKAPAVRSMLNDLADILRDYVVVEGRRSRRYRLRRPSDPSSDPYEVVALAVAREMAVFLKDSLLDQHLQRAASQAAARLDPQQVSVVPDLSRMLITKTRLGAPHGVDPADVDLVVQCLLEGRPFRGRYCQFNGAEHEVTLHAYSLILAEEGLYVYGRCLDSEKVSHIDTEREYNVARFSGLRVGIGRRTYPSLADYNPGRLFDHCWGIFLPAEGEGVVDARVAFDGRFAAFLSYHRYHRHQSEPEPLPDGRIAVTFRVYLTQDFLRFIRGFGRHQVEPLAPERLVRWYEDGRDPDHPERIA